MKKVESIQYLRGIAAVLVVAFHAALRHETEFKFGNCGVDIFFVISGFVMWFTTHDRNLTGLQFMDKRLRRIVPAYWIATLGFVLAIYLKPLFFVGVEVKPVWVIKSLLFVPYYNYMGNVQPVLWQGWTLNIELLFYAVFALFLWQRNLKYRIAGITASIVGLVIIGHIWKPHAAFFHIYMHEILIEFVFGVWLAWAFVRYDFSKVKFPVVAALAVVAIAIICLRTNDFGSEWRGVTVGVAALCLVFGALVLEEKGHIPQLHSLRILGDASYSVYLWHTLAMVVVYAFWIRFGFKNGWPGAFVLTLAGVGGGIVAYYLTEKPLLGLLNTKKPKKALR